MQNSKSMLTAFCVILLVLGFLTFSIISEAKLSLDFYSSGNSITFFLFGIKVLQIDIALASDENGALKIELKNKDKVVSDVDINAIIGDSGKEALRNAFPNPFYNLDIVEVDVYAEYGGGDAFRTVTVVSVVQRLLAIALRRLILSQQVKTYSCVKPNFQKNTIIFKLNGIFSITPADIIYGIIFSKKKEKKYDIGK